MHFKNILKNGGISIPKTFPPKAKTTQKLSTHIYEKKKKGAVKNFHLPSLLLIKPLVKC